jgi:hypothetical protein
MRTGAKLSTQVIATLTDDVVLPAPYVNVDRVENGQEREPP